jgi:pimeloyl-ACP methyl ester carboxylesterase
MEYLKAQTADGLILSGQLFESSNKENIIINVHGMAGDIYIDSFYPAMGIDYPLNGWSFLSGENRGTHVVTQFNTVDGKIKNIGDAFERFEDCTYDIQAWIDEAVKLGYKKIWLQGHSLGPSKIVYYMYKNHPNNIEGLIWLSPSDMVGLTKSPEDINDHEICLKQAKELVENGHGNTLLDHLIFGCYMLSANTYINMFGENTKLNVFNYNGDEGWEAVNSINIPVISFTGTNDDGIMSVIEPKKAMDILESKLINSPRKHAVVYDNADHGFVGFERDITNEVLKFINNN